jgi:hypothetical protein
VRILYGLENLPRDPENPRLPAVTVGPAMLRLNSEPLPADLAPVEPSHAARVAALGDWLLAQCGDYAAERRRFMTSYLDWVAAAIAAHRAELTQKLARFDGLFVAEDFFWSAPRPLPRAWLPSDRGWQGADLVFWDGVQALRIDAALPPDVQLPDALTRFWDAETLPKSPFRRAVEWPQA